MGRRLKDVADVHYGKRQNEVVDAYGRYPIYGTGGVFGMASRPLFQGPGVVVGRKGTLDNPQFVASDFWVVDTAYAVLPREETHPKWLYYALAKVNLADLNEATGVPSLSRERLYRVPVPDISFDEQSRIAYVLDTIDEAIQKTEAVIAKLKQIRAGMLHDLLTYGLDKDGKLRDPVAHPEQFKDSELGRIPKEWEVAPVGEASDFLVGPAFSSSGYATNSGVRLLRGINITEGYIRWERGITQYWESITADTERYAIKCGDVVIGMDGALVGRNVALVKDGDTPSLLVQRVARLRPSDGLEAGYLFMHLASHRFRNYVDTRKTHTAIPHISGGDIKEFEIPIPPIGEQESILTVTENSDELLTSHRVELRKLTQLRSGLTDDLLSGGVPVPEDLLTEGVPA